jgi:hypothetical protein
VIQFPILIGHSYFNQGFINIGVLYENHFPQHGMQLNVYLGNWGDHHLVAWVNREANPNFTPRIMLGIDYTYWIQQNHNIGENIVVTIQNPDFPNAMLLQ